VVHELKRLYDEEPHLKGWDQCRDLLDKRSADPRELSLFNPSASPTETLPGTLSKQDRNPSDAPYSLLPSPNSPTPDSPPRGGYPTDFEKLWNLYPAKRDKKAAYKAYQKAAKEVDYEVLTAGVIRYRDDPNREARFTKHFSTWLNAGSWDDEPLPERGGKVMDHSARGLAKGMAMLQAYDAQQEPFALEA
jgi:hypothetical protein